VCALTLVGASVASAQEGFTVKTTDVGPVIGVGGLSGAGVGFGGRFEKGFKELPDLRDGVLSWGISVDYYSFGQTFVTTSGYDWKVIPISGTVSYHFRLDERKLDPFFGAGLGYQHYSVSGPNCVIGGFDYCNSFSNSGVYFVARAGIRYYWQPKMALYADVGSGAGSLHLGIMFKLPE